MDRGGLQPTGSQRVRHDSTAQQHTAMDRPTKQSINKETLAQNNRLDQTLSFSLSLYGTLPFVTIRMDLEDAKLSEISHTEKDKYHMISFTRGI